MAIIDMWGRDENGTILITDPNEPTRILPGPFLWGGDPYDEPSALIVHKDKTYQVIDGLRRGEILREFLLAEPELTRDRPPRPQPDPDSWRMKD